GLFLGSLPVLGTLEELRSALTEAEAMLTGGSGPRVSPFPALGDCAGLLQRAGFLLPVADLETVHLSYADGISLLRDLRAAGETNALALRDRRTPPRELFAAALARMAGADGRISVTLQLATMTGWAPG
ncbi:MAG: SAM-dependent methyltransferase, partial [Acetobacteraceae bacterium]|nr:SAM-dependent methyltransferase [Acetobacteraceae bacterium]